MSRAYVLYVWNTASCAMRRAPSMTFLSAGSVGVGLLLVGLWFMLVLNVEQLAVAWGSAGCLSVELDPGLSPSAWSHVHAQVAALPEVQKSELITPQLALARFAARSNAAAALVEGVDPDVLTASVELQLRKPATDLMQLQSLRDGLHDVAGVLQLDLGDEQVAHLLQLAKQMHTAGWLLGALLAVAATILISNTIRMTIFARRDEIAILRLVGATPWFVRAPFLLEGALWGLMGGMVGALGLWSLHRLMAPRLSGLLASWTDDMALQLYTPSLAWLLALSGIFLGVCGSAVALRRFMAYQLP